MRHIALILGSMDEFVELVKLAKMQGIHTIVCDGYANGPAKRFADESYTIDVRDTDAIAALCKERGVDGIITSFSDLLAECMVNIAAKAGLPCYAIPERFRVLREKPLMKKMFDELKISHPCSVAVHKGTIAGDIAPIGFPCVVKPVNGYGSRGIYVLDDAEQVEERFDEVASYSSFDYILAERYNDGFEINMMSWIIDGEPVVLGMADREKTREVLHAIPHVSRNIYPSRFAKDAYDEARSIVKRVAAYVGISTGPLSMQFFYTPGKGIEVCEVAGRLFGYEHELVTYGSGLSIEQLLLDYLYDRAAMKSLLEGHTPFYSRCSMGCYFHAYEGEVAQVNAASRVAALPGVVEVKEYYQPGEVVSHGVGAKPYAVRCYAVADDRETADALSEKIVSEVEVLDVLGNQMLYRNEIPSYGVRA